MFLHSSGVKPYRANIYDDNGNDIGDDDRGDDCDVSGDDDDDDDDSDGGGDDDVGDNNDEGLGLGFELGLGLGLGMNWGGAGGVGCVCYDMGQRSIAMCFAVEGNINDGGNDNRGNNPTHPY